MYPASLFEGRRETGDARLQAPSQGVWAEDCWKSALPEKTNIAIAPSDPSPHFFMPALQWCSTLPLGKLRNFLRSTGLMGPLQSCSANTVVSAVLWPSKRSL